MSDQAGQSGNQGKGIQMEGKTMIQRLRERSEVESGFTLIELLIVITILGILAAIVVFAVGTTGSNAKTSACQADKHTVEVAIEAYKAKHSSYPTAPASPFGASQYASLTGTSEQYLKEAPPASEAITWDSNGTVTGSC
jgi:general secretion pathway protein G